MKWEIKTNVKKYIVESNSSSDAVAYVKEIDDSNILYVKISPENISGKLKKLWRDTFVKK
tara:strand:+ start:276 stop:455 length:180 start_codon:yes stop_codon:yes gene_type:complete